MPIDPNDTPANITQTSSSTFGVSDAQIIGNAGNRTNPVQAIKNYQGVNAGPALYKFPLDTPKYYMTLETSEYSRASLTKLNFTTIDTIVLPLPWQMNDQNTVDYTEDKLGSFFGNIADGIIKGYNEQNKSNLATRESLSQGQRFLDDAAAGAVNATVVGLPKVVGNIVDAALPINELWGLTGYTPNQFFVVLLNRPTYKQFSMYWRLYPRNLKESQVIKNICNRLNNAKAVGIAGPFWKFPLIFRLGFHPKASWLYKFKPAVLENLTIEYTPNGSAAFYNSAAPEAIHIQAQFKEMEYWLADDYTDSDDITNTGSR